MEVFYHGMENSRLKITQETVLRVDNPGQTQTTFKFFEHLKVLYHWIEDSILRIAQTRAFLEIIHPDQPLNMFKFL